MDATSRKMVESEFYNMVCIDEDFDLYGDFNSETASNLMITFELCDEKVRTCKSRETINEILPFSYMLVIEN